MERKLLKSENKIESIYFKVKSVDKVNYTVEGVFSAEVEDRQGEIVVQSGWLLENYMKNPIVLWAHQSDKPPIGKMLNIAVNPATNQLEGKMQFAVNEYDFAATIFYLIVGGYQKAFSAGFINNKYEIDQENDKVYLLENELLEMSVVPVPANQLALAKSKGLDVSKYESHKKEFEDDEIEPSDEELEELENEEIGDDEALDHISKSNLETIRTAIKTLTDVLNASAELDKQVGQKVEHSSSKKEGEMKKISVNILNRAVKELLKVKSKL